MMVSGNMVLLLHKELPQSPQKYTWALPLGSVYDLACPVVTLKSASGTSTLVVKVEPVILLQTRQ